MSSDYIRIIDPSEIKVGMVIEWDNGDDFIVKCTVTSVDIQRSFTGADYYINGEETDLGLVAAGTSVRVICESDIIQPEEPTSFGACVTVNDMNFLRYTTDYSSASWQGDDDSVADWSEICNLGQVKIVNEDPFSESE